MKVVIDCANGAAFKAAPKALEELGAEVVVMNDKPDGININQNCGHTMENIMDFIKRVVQTLALPLAEMLTGSCSR